MHQTQPTGNCPDCGFDWAISLDEAVGLVSGAPDRYAVLLVNGAGTRSEDPAKWSAAGYLWHVIDVLRFGTERLWTLSLDAGAGVPGWDQEAIAADRQYEKLSPRVGLRALKAAVRDWVDAAREAPVSAKVWHPVLGDLTTADSIRRNAHEVQHHALDITNALEDR